MQQNCLSAYRIMWIFVMFDLPVVLDEERKAASDFRKKLLKDGFSMHQFSVYVRVCSSREDAETHSNRVKINVPHNGLVSVLMITDKQFGMIKNYWGKVPKPSKHKNPDQLELF
jgi:CRISPR-associated protein Cas2